VCVASSSNQGDVVASSNPTGGTRAWAFTKVDGKTALNGLSCPSVSLCVAVDGAGDVVYGPVASLTAPASRASLRSRTGVMA
jgi:hypothetical protein